MAIYDQGLEKNPAFASTLTTMALYHNSLRWFALPSCKAKAVGLPPSLIQLAFEVLQLQNFLGTRPFNFLKPWALAQIAKDSLSRAGRRGASCRLSTFCPARGPCAMR